MEERNGGLGSIEVTYRLTDLFAINFRAWRSYLKQLVVGELIFVGIIVTISLVSRRGLLAGLHGVHWRFLAMLGSALGFFLIAYWFAACPLIGYLQRKRRGMLGPIRFSLRARGVEAVGPNSESLSYWSGIKKVVQTKRRLYLFLTPASALIMPRRAFATDDEFQTWADRSRSSWSEAKGVTVE